MRALIAVACVAAGPGLAGTPDAIAGEEAFHSLCAGCHGVEAEGDGPLGALLTVTPPDLTMLSAANGGVFPVFQVVRQIDGRDPFLAHGGEMPLFGEIFDLPDAAIADASGQPIITSQVIADLVAWLQTVQE